MIRHFVLPAVVVIILAFAKGLVPASIVLASFVVCIGLNRLGNSRSLSERSMKEIVHKSGKSAQATIYILSCTSVILMLAATVMLFLRYDWIVAASFILMIILFVSSLNVAYSEEQRQKETTEGLLKQIAQKVYFPLIIKYHPWSEPILASIRQTSDLYKSDPTSSDKILIEQMDVVGKEMGGYLIEKLLERPNPDQELKRFLNLSGFRQGASFMKMVKENLGVNDMGSFLVQKFSQLHMKWTGIPATEKLLGVRLDEDWQ